MKEKNRAETILSNTVKIIVMVLLCFSISHAQQECDLIEATISGDHNLVRELILNGTDVNCRDKSGQSPLHHACYLGYFDIVKQLIDSGAIIDIKVPQAELTPLHAATMNGDINIVGYLVERGAEIDSEDHRGATPIFAACWIGNLSVVKFLVEAGAAIGITTHYGTSLLHHAAQSGNLALVKFLVDKDLDVNSTAMNGSTPLHIAVAIENKELVEYLIGKEANIHIRMKEDFLFIRCIKAPILTDDDVTQVAIHKGQSPVDIARARRYKEILEILEHEKKR